MNNAPLNINCSESIDELHSDPDNLIFYLAKNNFNTLSFEIIKKQNIQSAFGKIELAIIGSSHYLKLDNYFTELMTCSQEEMDSKQLLFVKKENESFEYAHDFQNFKYKFIVKTIFYQNTKNFEQFEISLLNKKDIFSHEFCNKSAITALKYQNSENRFSLQSWHTYPEHSKIIFSETLLYR